jgi:hypothetical protein
MLSDPSGAQGAIKRVAVMQPYFFPYAGYFRLFFEVDEFVIFDCVQFPRRGRVHRTQVPGPNGRLEWLTLPLAYHPRDVLIRDLAFSRCARAQFDERLARLPWVRSSNGLAADRFRSFLFGPLVSVVNYLETGLKLVADVLEFDIAVTRSSTLDIDKSLWGEARVIAVAKSVHATHYVNLPGGRALYNLTSFVEAGIRLCFLSPYKGSFFQLLPALMTGNLERIREDICETSEVSML